MKPTLLLMLVLIGFAAPAQNASLRYHLRKGQVFTVQFNSQRQSVFTLKEKPVLVTLTTDVSLELKVIGEKRNAYEFEAAYKLASVKIKSDASPGEIIFSSTDTTSTDLSSNVLGKIMSKSFSIKMTAQGDLQKITGLDEIIDNEYAKLTYLPDSIQNIFKKQLSGFFGETKLKIMLQPFTHIYPSENAGLTNHWATRSHFEKPSTFNIVMYYMVNEPTRLQLTGFGELFLQYDDLISGGVATTKLYGKLTSETELDLRTGWPLKTILIQNLTGDETEIKKGEAPVKIPKRVLNEIRYELQIVND